MNPFAAPPAAPPIDPEEARRVYPYWRTRTLYATFVGYAVYYFVRTNIPLAIPLIIKDLGVTKADMGKILSWHGIVYGVSKFANGVLGDRSNPRLFMAVGLLLSALCNVCFGFSSALQTFAIWWILNAWFQGMGFPPVARLLSHWFSAKERGRKWGIWNTSHQVGGATIAALAGYLGVHFGWRAVFWVPAAIAVVASLFVYERLRDTPEAQGLMPVEDYMDDVKIERPPLEESFATTLVKRVFSNPYIWFICLANFFVYVVRYSFFNWAPTYLTEVKHADLQQAGNINAGFEIAGLIGSLLAGYLSDTVFRGRRTPVCVLYMIGTALAILAFWRVPGGHLGLDAGALCAVGFFIYGPQFLVGVMVTDLASKEAAATAIGLTGFFGYVSTIISGWGLGQLVTDYGWDAAFEMLLVSCALAAIPFALCWRKS